VSAATLVNASSGFLAGYSDTPVSAVSVAFDTGDWTTSTGITVSLSSSRLRTESTTFAGVVRNTTLGDRSAWLVQQKSRITAPGGWGSSMGPCARIETVTAPNDFVRSIRSAGTLTTDKLQEVVAGSEAAADSDSPITKSLDTGYWFSLATAASGAQAYDHATAATQTINLTGGTYVGRAGFYHAGTATEQKTDHEEWFAATSRYLTVNGPTATWRARVLDSGDSVLAYADAAAGVATVDMLSVIMLNAVAIDIYDTDTSAVIIEAVPASRVWGGDTWTYTAGNPLLYSGLDHLEGEAVSVVADGVTIASPNNPAYATITVASGAATIPGGPYTTVSVGLPITTDIQTLDLDNGNSFRKDAGINITRVGLWLEDSKTPFVGEELPATNAPTDLQQMPQTDENGTVTTSLISGYREVQVDGAFTTQGSIVLRQIDPQPLTVLSVVPQGTFGRS